MSLLGRKLYRKLYAVGSELFLFFFFNLLLDHSTDMNIQTYILALTVCVGSCNITTVWKHLRLLSGLLNTGLLKKEPWLLGRKQNNFPNTKTVLSE